MPTEYRFDDLDLREEPHKGDTFTGDPISTDTCRCTLSQFCTESCCTCNCP